MDDNNSIFSIQESGKKMELTLTAINSKEFGMKITNIKHYISD